jgi:hypothetical protein
MLTFGKYKGKSLKEILKFDKQYIKWLIKENLAHKLDKEDAQMIYFFKHPLIDIDIDNISEEELITTLKNRNLLYCAYDYCDDTGAIHYKIDSAYKFECGGISSICNIPATNNLKEMIVEHFRESNIY